MTHTRAGAVWRATIQNLTTRHHAHYGTRRGLRIVLPAVGADRLRLGSGGDGPSVPASASSAEAKTQTQTQAEAKGHSPCAGGPVVDGSAQRLSCCDGWLADFKRATLQLPCTSPSGERTNCWDVTSAINLHVAGEASRAGAAQVLRNIEDYAKAFADDLAGTDGRSRKSLWLTEVTVASAEISEILPFVAALMDERSGLRNRGKRPPRGDSGARTALGISAQA